jgi:ubiquinone/menaquinone biosynthesis C-methylase UbiE
MALKRTYEHEVIHSRWESVYRSHPTLRRFNDRVLDTILGNLRPPSDALFLDAGCGVGDHSLRIASRGYRCVGVDLSEKVLGIAEANAVADGLHSRVHFTCQALENLGFGDDTFDAVHCRGVLMHIPDWKKALASLCRVLKPGGRIVILESNHQSLEMGLVLLVRKVRHRRSRMIKTEGGFEFWSEEEGEPFVVRVADIRSLTAELERNGTRMLKRIAHEFWDINRFPQGALRRAAIQFNYLHFLSGLPYFGCIGNAIIAEKQARFAPSILAEVGRKPNVVHS